MTTKHVAIGSEVLLWCAHLRSLLMQCTRNVMKRRSRKRVAMLLIDIDPAMRGIFHMGASFYTGCVRTIKPGHATLLTLTAGPPRRHELLYENQHRVTISFSSSGSHDEERLYRLEEEARQQSMQRLKQQQRNDNAKNRGPRCYSRPVQQQHRAQRRQLYGQSMRQIKRGK